MAPENSRERYGELWTRQELILAFDLYCRIPFKKTKANNADVIELAKLLGRSPASVARKLGNFGSFDPQLRRQHITGLAHTGKLDAEVWDQFNADWNRLVLEANRLRAEFGGDTELRDDVEPDIPIPHGPSEREAMRKNRVHQGFFRDAILSSYEETCCITGLKVRECLVASHIVPWSESEEHRTDPRNGLCLSATFDRLFDRGLITINESLDVVVSSRLRKADDEKTLDMISRYHGSPIVPPLRFLPLPAHLEWHHKNVFQG